MLEVFNHLQLEDDGVAIADVTTATPLDADSENLVEQQLSELIGKKLEVRYHVDPSIIGGLVAQVGDTLVDGSVSSQLAPDARPAFIGQSMSDCRNVNDLILIRSQEDGEFQWSLEQPRLSTF